MQDTSVFNQPPLPQVQPEKGSLPEQEYQSESVTSEVDTQSVQPERPTAEASDQYEAEETPVDEYQQAYFPNVAKPTVEELVYQWTAPTRPFKQRSKQFYTTIITIAVLISLILFFAGQILPIAVIVAVVFLFYVLSTIPPTNTTIQLTTFGIRFEEQLYFWEELGRFWFDEAYGKQLINIEVTRFPNRLTLMLGEGEPELIAEMLSEVLVMQKPVPTLYEKFADWLSEKIPLDMDK